jgi:hypothetical protein
MPPRATSSDNLNALIARITPDVLALLADGVPRDEAAIVAALNDAHVHILGDCCEHVIAKTFHVPDNDNGRHRPLRVCQLTVPATPSAAADAVVEATQDRAGDRQTGGYRAAAAIPA